MWVRKGFLLELGPDFSFIVRQKRMAEATEKAIIQGLILARMF